MGQWPSGVKIFPSGDYNENTRMKTLYLLVLGLALAPAVWAQDQELPDAPSANLHPKASQPALPSSANPQPNAPSSQPQTQAPTLEPPPGTQPAPQAKQSPAQTAPQATAPQAAKADSPDEEDAPTTTIVKRVDEVNVIFTVTDKHGHFIKDMKQEDFMVLDNKLPARAVQSFRAETDLPLRVGLLIDASNSIRDRFHFEQEAAAAFLNQVVRPRSDRAFVIGFDTTPEVTQDFTDSTDALTRGIRMLRPGGGTALYDAVYYACRDKLMKTQQQGPVRRAIILVSDGDDNQSRVTGNEAIEMAQRAEVIIYAISTNISGIKMRGDKVLEHMAEATGGRAFFPFKMDDVASAFSEIQDELRSQYALAYKPAVFAPDGQYHSIEILAENHKNYKVRSRKGYYAPTQ
jgi:Ca-activated chloride channel homolog